MTKKKRFTRLTVLLLALVIVLAGCGGNKSTDNAANNNTNEPAKSEGTPTASTEKKVLNIGLPADPPGMDPMQSTSLYDRQVYQSLYNKLFDIDENGNIVPSLVTEYKISDDGLTYTFKLQQGVKFHDGSDFNAEVVKYNFERMTTNEKSKRKGELKVFESATVVDPYTVDVKLKAPYAPFLGVLTDRSGMMVSMEAAEKYGDDLINNPVGTGPFVFVEKVTGDHVTVKKNENYWAGEVKLDEVNYRVFTNGSAGVQNLRSGMLDIFTDIPPKEIPTVEQDSNLTVIAKANLGYQGVYLNTTVAPLDNKYIRQAISKAIDRELLVKALLNGYGSPANSPFAPAHFAHGDSDKSEKPDAAVIKDLLAKGGKPDGFSIKLQIGTSPVNEQTGVILQDMLKKHNINVELEKVEYGTMIENGEKGNFQMLQLGWSGRIDPDGNIYDFVVTGTANNDSRISEPELDDVLNQARTEVDNTKRKALYDRAMEILHDNSGYVYLYHNFDKFGFSKKVKGYTYIADGLIRTANLDKE